MFLDCIYKTNKKYNNIVLEELKYFNYYKISYFFINKVK